MTDDKAEIERLEAHNRSVVGSFDAISKNLNAEIEQLKAMLATCRELRKYDRKDIERLTAEVESLKAQLGSRP